MIFENCILKTYFFTPWPTYTTNWNDLNNFGRWTPWNNSCEIGSKSNEWFQRRSCLKKLLTHGWTHRRTTNNGQSQKLTLSTLRSCRWFNKGPKGPHKGCSPEEKVKCQIGAIYRGSLVLYTNYQGSSLFLQEDFQKFLLLLYINQIYPRAGTHFILRA